MTRQIIPLRDHEHSLDPTARIVREERARWTIYSVRAGFVVALAAAFPDLLAIADTFPTEREAIEAARLAA